MTILTALAWTAGCAVVALALAYGALVFAMWIIGRLPDMWGITDEQKRNNVHATILRCTHING